jgi:hypothetical protein
MDGVGEVSLGAEFRDNRLYFFREPEVCCEVCDIVWQPQSTKIPDRWWATQGKCKVCGRNFEWVIRMLEPEEFEK